jgi:molybdopterin molybdotransferase
VVEFLNLKSSDKAFRLIVQSPIPLDVEDIPLETSLGHVLARDVRSPEDLPAFSRSLVDGYAVKAADTHGASETNPAPLTLKGEVLVGMDASLSVARGSCAYVSTGAMVPRGADGIVMQEYTSRTEDLVQVGRTVHKGENITFAGEELRRGRTVLKKGTVVNAFAMGVLGALGISRLPVFRQARVGLISSGDELIPVDEGLAPGRVRDINRYSVTGLLSREGSEVSFHGIAGDNLTNLCEMLGYASNDDLILVSGGSSKGTRDFMTAALTELGGTVLFHGINIRPGKPTIYGRLHDKPVFGLPGHPISCAMVVIRFVLPLIRASQGQNPRPEPAHFATLSSNVPSSPGIEEYVAVTVEKTRSGYSANPIFTKSSALSSLTGASGYIVVPHSREGLDEGEPVEVFHLG